MAEKKSNAGRPPLFKTKGNRIFEGDILKYNWKDKEVIGNRWDDPELLVTE